jgi:drug/metabolite transporter (DMT)-like permease
MRLALLALAVVFLSQPANLIRWAHAPIEVIGFWRLLIAAAALTPGAWLGRRSWTALAPRARPLAVLAGALFFAHLWSYVYAVQHAPVANVMAAFCTHPLWTGAGLWLLEGERPTPRLGAAYVLAGAGVWALVSDSLGAGGLAGGLAGLGSAALFSCYILTGRRLRRQLDNSVYAAAVFWVSAACFFAAGSARGVAWTGYPAASWAAFVGLGVGVTLAGHALFTYLLGSMDVNLLGCAKLFEPILGALTAWAAFGEPLRPRTAWAFAAIAAAVLVLLWPSGRPLPVEPAELDE